jgi:DeoR family transcriptional regulator, aga operon transcriptional repressor
MPIETALSNLERQQRLLGFVEEQQRITIGQICNQFSVSVATARRDLEVLAGQGKVQRVHGGAIAIRHAPPEPPVLVRASQQSDVKDRIGRATADLITDGETVFLGSGTTVLEVARNLHTKKNLTVITNSLLVITTLAHRPDMTIIGLGGILRRTEMSLIGHIVELSLKELRADKVIIGIRAIDIERGLTNDYLPETMTDRAILSIGREVILVADHTKCATVSTGLVAPVSAIHTLVTDTETSSGFVAALKTRGIRVLTV